MKICLGEGFQFGQYPFEDAMKAISNIGYDHVELLTGSHLDANASDDQIKEKARVMDNVGIKAAAVLGGGPLASLDAAIRDQAVKSFKRQIVVARLLGCDYITSEMNGGTSLQLRECIDAFKASMREVAPVLEGEGVQASFEAHPGDFVEDNNLGVDILKEIGHKNIGYLYCGPHTFILGEDPAAMIEYAADILNWVHVADSYREERIIISFAPKGHATVGGTTEFKNTRGHLHLVPGDGEVDFACVFRTLKKIGYDGFVSAIPFDSTTPVEAATQSLRMIQKYISES